MQSFVIFYKSFYIYKVGASIKTDAGDKTLKMLGIVVVSTSVSLDWFNPAKIC